MWPGQTHPASNANVLGERKGWHCDLPGRGKHTPLARTTQLDDSIHSHLPLALISQMGELPTKGGRSDLRGDTERS